MDKQDLISKLDLSVKAEFVPFSQSEGCKDSSKFAIQKPNEAVINWRVTLYKDGNKILQTPYKQGIVHLPGYRVRLAGNKTLYEAKIIQKALETGIVPMNDGIAKAGKIPEPKIEDVLYSLLLDGAADFDAQTFEEWCFEYGYDTDSISAYDTYRKCLEIGQKLRNRLGMDAIEKLREAFIDY